MEKSQKKLAIARIHVDDSADEMFVKIVNALYLQEFPEEDSFSQSHEIVFQRFEMTIRGRLHHH